MGIITTVLKLPSRSVVMFSGNEYCLTVSFHNSRVTVSDALNPLPETLTILLLFGVADISEAGLEFCARWPVPKLI